MTKEEAAARYHIPVSLLDEYAGMRLCDSVKQVMDVWQYDDTDIERLSMIMTLHDIGFDKAEVEAYMRLLLSDGNTERERMAMLEAKRTSALDEIHLKELQLTRIDYLRHEIKTKGEEKKK